MNGCEYDRASAPAIKPVVLRLRIIVLAMAAGVCTFAVCAVFIRQRGDFERFEPSFDVLVLLGMALTPAALIASWLAGAAIARSVRRALASRNAAEDRPGGPSQMPSRSDVAGVLANMYQVKTILGVAPLEGVAFLNVMAYLFVGNLIGLGLGVALAAAIVGLYYPSTSRVASWIDRQLRLVEEEQLLVH